ncbi:MAG: FG-GAP repeat protein [Phycisphaerales bacterium]|nr:FG-GAP repeat protein [Phycisphaerales bacterium]
MLSFWDSGTGIREINIDQIGSPDLPGYVIVGRSGERSSFAGSDINGDYLGGGDAANPLQGGTTDKAPIPAIGGDRGKGVGLASAGDVDGDGFDDFLLGAQLADPRVSASTGEGVRNGGEAYLIFGGQ